MPLIIKKQQLVQICEDNNKSSNSTLVNESKGVVVEKFIVEITRYPDGKSFSKIYSIGEQKKINKELQKPAKGVKKLNINDKEVEELE